MKYSSGCRTQETDFMKFSIGLYHWNRRIDWSEIFRTSSDYEYLEGKWSTSPQSQQKKFWLQRSKIQFEQKYTILTTYYLLLTKTKTPAFQAEVSSSNPTDGIFFYFFFASFIIFMVKIVLNGPYLYINHRKIVVIVKIVEITEKSQKQNFLFQTFLKRFRNVFCLH